MCCPLIWGHSQFHRAYESHEIIQSSGAIELLRELAWARILRIEPNGYTENSSPEIFERSLNFHNALLVMVDNCTPGESRCLSH